MSAVILRDGKRLRVVTGFADAKQAESFVRGAGEFHRALRVNGDRYDAGDLLVADSMALDEAANSLFPGGPEAWQEHEKARLAADAERKRQEAAERKRREEERQAALREQEIRRRLALKAEQAEAEQYRRWREEIEVELDVHHKK